MSAAFSCLVFFLILKKLIIRLAAQSFYSVENQLLQLNCCIVSQYFIFNIYYTLEVKQHLRCGCFVVYELIHFQPSCCCVLCMYL